MPLFTSRWLALAACLILQGIGGTSYAFGIYSNQLKSMLNFHQSDIQLVGSIGNIGLYIGFISGIVFDRFGPSPTIAIGMVLSGAGYYLFYAGSLQTVPHSVLAMSAYAFLWSNGSNWYDCASVASSVRNFPHNRGLILGLLKSFFGLSASILAMMYSNVFPGETSDFLLFLAIACPAGGLVSIFLVSVGKESGTVTSGERLKILLSTSGVFVLAAYICVVSVLLNVGEIEHSTVYAIIMAPLLVIQVVLVLPSRWFGGVPETGPEGEKLLNAAQEDLQKKTMDAPVPDFTLLQALCTLDYYLLIVVLVIGTGSGLTVINNISQQALACGAKNGAVYVVILSISNCAGRISFGILSDRLQHQLTRPTWLALITTMMAGAMALNATATPGTLYAASILTGFSYGGYWVIFPALLAEIFGTTSFASLYAVSSLSPAVGSLLFSALMASKIYDAHTLPGEIQCYGPQCFQLTFLILCGGCALAAMTSLFLRLRLRKFYSAATIAVDIE